jgi:hypothetical protein
MPGVTEDSDELKDMECPDRDVNLTPFSTGQKRHSLTRLVC